MRGRSPHAFEDIFFFQFFLVFGWGKCLKCASALQCGTGKTSTWGRWGWLGGPVCATHWAMALSGSCVRYDTQRQYNLNFFQFFKNPSTGRRKIIHRLFTIATNAEKAIAIAIAIACTALRRRRGSVATTAAVVRQTYVARAPTRFRWSNDCMLFSCIDDNDAICF